MNKSIFSEIQWHMPVILTVGNQRQEDCYKLEIGPCTKNKEVFWFMYYLADLLKKSNCVGAYAYNSRTQEAEAGGSGTPPPQQKKSDNIYTYKPRRKKSLQNPTFWHMVFSTRAQKSLHFIIMKTAGGERKFLFFSSCLNKMIAFIH